MTVEIVRKNDAYHFVGSGSTDNVEINIDASPAIGGVNAGVRPMELLLMGLAACSAIDVVLILKKQRQIIEDIRIKTTGDREKIEGTEMSPFRKINLHYIFKGNLDAKKVEKAIQLSMEKYCSATAQFRDSAKLTHSFEINE